MPAMEFILYYYTPSAAAAGIFVVLFGISTVLHFLQLVRTRTWFMIPFFIGGILEAIGYVGRLLSSLESPDYSTGSYAMQSALILIAPAFLAASIYMTLGRIIRMVQAEHYSVFKLKWVTKIFVAGDVLSFLMQASGAGLMVSGSSDPTTGEHIIIGGLFVQIIFFGFFIITALVFQVRLAKAPTSTSAELSHIWRRHMNALYISSILIFVRSIVRVVEYLQGYDGYLMKHEVFIYVFDALLMFLAMEVLQFIHPSQVNCYLGRGERYSDKVIKTQKFMSVPVEMEVSSV
ncbi:RTA1-domain-containing protein [Aspergillus eucalypticola CBS 122712]|uniref:RTA1-domain-containing protein n=1 Tax=Aspergillus eucalypticola (strain CBS 122712 / IBT 29274) TaxID=1448314 RepID=A0A317VHX6_ASPEC|nr:RTA1-domain-containing protein [Aspergillus eucalypticola CBS 122712]PWY72618.1 RTA1-domain-containing protein [Aspergillus eucalypticola CBS 122712]